MGLSDVRISCGIPLVLRTFPGAPGKSRCFGSRGNTWHVLPREPKQRDLPGAPGNVRKTRGIPQEIRTSLSPIGRKISLALLYGSVARGEERADSDIDVLIVAD